MMLSDLWFALTIICGFFFVLFIAWADVTHWHQVSKGEKKLMEHCQYRDPEDL